MIRQLGGIKDSFTDIFNFKSDEGRGRVISLSASLLTAIYNMFISGLFYTGFLTMYGMSITDAGILSFVPFIANMLSIFSPKLLGRFKKRKKILLTAKVIYFFLNIVVTTFMPQIVTGTKARMICFIVISSVATGFFTLFNSGFTTWFYNFYPKESERRARFFSFSLIISSVLSNVILLASSLLTDALSNSPYQNTLIIVFRYFAFAMVLLEVFLQSKAKEYPYEESENLKFSDVFTLPFKQKKFMRCMAIQFMWCFVCYINNLWGYHQLNHLKFSYTLVNSMSIVFAVFLIVFSPMWRKLLRRYSWIKTFGLSLLIHAPSEWLMVFMTENDAWLFVVTMIYQHIMSVGVNLAYGNILYMNLPKENSTAYICFNVVGCNIFSFIGMVCGTWISSFTGDVPIPLWGMDFYSVQIIPIIRFAVFMVFSLWMIIRWRDFTSDELIEEIDELRDAEKYVRRMRRSVR
ncbi:MAG: MFS transporter [Oscillospiraceae bacterium]|nr:MFS transporter [Oscillospiraceae bacterium]